MFLSADITARPMCVDTGESTTFATEGDLRLTDCEWLKMSTPTFVNRPDLRLTKALSTLGTISGTIVAVVAEIGDYSRRNRRLVASVDRAKGDGKHFFQLGPYTVHILGAKKIEIETSIFAAKIDQNRSFFQKSTSLQH